MKRLIKGVVLIGLMIPFSVFPAPTLLPTPLTVSGQSTVLEIATVRDITFSGSAQFEASGDGVAIGDLNDDGVPDLIIGAQGGDPLGRTNAGITYVVLGPVATGTLPSEFDLAVEADIKVYGEAAWDLSGVAVASGDLNGDNVADLGA